MRRRRRLGLDVLEDRTAPAVFGQPWAMPTHLTLSFAPDGTRIAGQASDLFQTLGASQSTTSWQQTILEAVQAWSSVAHLDVAVVSDGGQPFGTPGAIQGDPRFGDIRIGAEAMSPDSSALSFPPDPYFAGTWAGDIVLNDSDIADASAADLYDIMLHEVGHALGLPDNADASSVMFPQPGATAGQLAPSDVAAIQALYGPPDSSQAGNNSFAAAAPVPTPRRFDGSAPIVAYGALSNAQPAVFYSFSVPRGYQGGVTVHLLTAGLSLLEPLVSVYDESGNLLGSAISTNLGGGEISVPLGQAGPGATDFVKVEAATPGSFDGGRFGLAVSFDAASQVPASAIDSVLAGPYEGLSADQINRLLRGSEDFSSGAEGSGSQLTTAIPLATTAGFALDTRFQAVDNMRNMEDSRYYTFQAPASIDGNPLVFTAGLDAAASEGHSGRLVLLDGSGNPVPSSVLIDAGGVYTIQAVGLTPGATYFLRMEPPDGASDGGGNSILVADFLQPSDLQTGFEANTLSAAKPQATSTLYVAQSQFFQFQLAVSAAQSDASGAVRMTILDQNGVVVLDFAARAGRSDAVSLVLLTPGQYSVEFSAIGGEDDSPSNLSYSVQGAVISDPIGPIVHNPTYKPIYIGPPGKIPTYRYPNGRISAIPYFWLTF